MSLIQADEVKLSILYLVTRKLLFAELTFFKTINFYVPVTDKNKIHVHGEVINSRFAVTVDNVEEQMKKGIKLFLTTEILLEDSVPYSGQPLYDFSKILSRNDDIYQAIKGGLHDYKFYDKSMIDI